jgi:1-acyl-sn-glycerol-3-phosphate acyltransferase
MNLLRTLAFFLFELITVIPWSVLSIVTAVLPRPIHYNIVMFWLDMQIWAAKVIMGIRYQVIGAENLPDGPAILLSKHQSTWETFFYPTFMPRQLCYVFKRELLFVPFFGWGIGLLDMIHINRSKGADAFDEIVRQGAEKLAQGRWIIMFPEGTRIPVGKTGRYKSGGARLAVRTGAPVVPIAVNAGEVWPKKPWIKRPGLVTVSIGPPISTQQRQPDAVIEEVEAWIEAQMRVISPHAYTTPPSN